VSNERGLSVHGHLRRGRFAARRGGVVGTQASRLVGAESLATHRREIGLRILYGQSVDHSYGHDPIMPRLNALGLKPLVWSHLPGSWSDRTSLDSGRLKAIVTVSDKMRISAPRRRRHQRVSRAPASAARRVAPRAVRYSDERAANSSKNT
jgi:hypothetical protein